MGISAEQGPWDERETEALVAAYFDMLARETRGEQYSKAAYNRDIQAATGRSKGSIEFKFCNVSHVLAELGLSYIDGYKPRSHVQDSLRRTVHDVVREMDPARQAFGENNLVTKQPDGAEPSPELGAGREFRDSETRLSRPLQDLEEILGVFWQRATGGGDVAARPDQDVDHDLPSAKRPPGVEEGLAWLKDGLSRTSLPRFLFLIGGPGAGKSHATASAVEDLTLVTKVAQGLAHRTYLYRGAEADLVVVNDATISEEGDRSPLVGDIDQIIKGTLKSRQTNLIACVNRGVLVEEVAELNNGSDDFSSPGAYLVRWLSGERQLSGVSACMLENVQGTAYARSASLILEGELRAHILAVFVDECSLFEIGPSVSMKHNSVQVDRTYKVSRLLERPHIEHDEMPAGDLINRLLAGVQDKSSRMSSRQLAADPLSANLRSLQSLQIRNNLLTIARSAELVSSIRMTYRELWGFLIRALVGNAPQTMTPEEMRSFIVANQPRKSNPKEDFAALRRLSNLRIHQSIFGAGDAAQAGEEAKRDPVLRLMAAVDPIRDALPGREPLDPAQGWCTPISDAFSSHHSEASPLEILLEHSTGGPFEEMIGDFDKVLDKAFVALMRDETLKDAERLRATAWYGAYLTRLYAVSHGISAFRYEIDTLLQVISDGHLPDQLVSPLRTLIRPKRNPQGGSNESLLPLFDSRTEPIADRVNNPKLAIRVEDLDLTAQRAGVEHVMLEIRKDGNTVGKMVLDFPLVREALACMDDRAGVTDLVDMTAPRLERIRSSRLKSRRLVGGEIRIAVGMKDHLLVHKGDDE